MVIDVADLVHVTTNYHGRLLCRPAVVDIVHTQEELTVIRVGRGQGWPQRLKRGNPGEAETWHPKGCGWES